MGLDRRTALKTARERFDKGDRRGASKALLEAGFSGAQVEAVFEGFLLEPSRKEARLSPGGGGLRPPPPVHRPAPHPPAKAVAPEPVKPGGDILRSLRKTPWRPVAVAGAVLVVALLLLRPGTTFVDGPPSPLPTATGVPTSPPADLGLPGVASAALSGCAWSDWTGDGVQDGVEAAVQFKSGSGAPVAVGLPRGSFQVTAALTETVKRFKFDNVSGPRFETENRVMPAAGAELVPGPGGWSLRLAADPRARAVLNFSDLATYLLVEEVKTSVSPRLPGSCIFG